MCPSCEYFLLSGVTHKYNLLLFIYIVYVILARMITKCTLTIFGIRIKCGNCFFYSILFSAQSLCILSAVFLPVQLNKTNKLCAIPRVRTRALF